jgi:hypothetical protein
LWKEVGKDRKEAVFVLQGNAIGCCRYHMFMPYPQNFAHSTKNLTKISASALT